MDDTNILNVGAGCLTPRGKDSMEVFNLAAEKWKYRLVFSRCVFSSAAHMKMAKEDGLSVIRGLVEALINLLKNLPNEEVRSA